MLSEALNGRHVVETDVQNAQVQVIYSIDQVIWRSDGHPPCMHKTEAAHFAESLMRVVW